MEFFHGAEHEGAKIDELDALAVAETCEAALAAARPYISQLSIFREQTADALRFFQVIAHSGVAQHFDAHADLQRDEDERCEHGDVREDADELTCRFKRHASPPIRHSGRAKRDPEPRGNELSVGPWVPGSSAFAKASADAPE
jgi:hypothetical protein